MSLVVFTGGVRSGKSGAAQLLAERRAALGVGVTVAVFGERSDPEMQDRIEHHQAHRPSGFRTIEATSAMGWTQQVPQEDLLLVDCLGSLLGRAMQDTWPETGGGAGLGDADVHALPEGFEEAVSRRFDDVVEWLLCRRGDTIVVTNEVGLGVVPEWASARLFRDLLGRANRRLVDVADAAYLVVAGRLVPLSGLAREAGWPED